MKKKTLVVLVICLIATITNAQKPETWVFTSIPDFMNADIGTLEGVKGYPDGWRGNLDSTTKGFEDTLSFYLDALVKEKPELVLVAGDLVEGEWHHDPSGRKIFGTYNTHQNRIRALNKAATCYYSQWLDRFTSRGLVPYPCVGDHELGDNDWKTSRSKARLVPNYKAAFARFFTRDKNGAYKYAKRPVGTPYEGTSYAFQHKNVLFVTVDVWRQDSPDIKLDNRTGSVLATVDGRHLKWLSKTLADAKKDPSIDHIIVQAHSPVLTPVRVRGSSELYLRDYDNTTDKAMADSGANTDFWKTLAAYDVDFFFCGEVHHNTLSISNKVIQIVHDGLPFTSGNYLVATVTGKKIDFKIKHVPIGPGQKLFWQTVSNKKQETVVRAEGLANGWQTVATATYDKTSGTKKLSNLTGELIPYGTNDGSIELDIERKILAKETKNRNFDFENPPNSGSTGELSQNVIGWEEFGEKTLIDFQDGDKAPVGMTNVCRLKGADKGKIWKNLTYVWSEKDIYKISFDAYEVGWRCAPDTTGDEIYFTLKEIDGTRLYGVGNINLDGTLSEDKSGSITYGNKPHHFEYIIKASDWMQKADINPGIQLQLLFGADGGVVWVDNIKFEVLSKTDDDK